MSVEPARQTSAAAPGRTENLVVKPRPRRAEAVHAVTLLCLIAWLVYFIATNENLRLDLVGTYLFHDEVLSGVQVTLLLTVVGMVGGTLLGMVLAVMRLSSSWVLRFFSASAVYLSRSIPLLVQLLFWYFLASIVPVISISIPFGPELWSADTNQLIGQIPAALIALSLFGAGYMAEIIRSGVMSVDQGQVEGAMSIGMPKGLIMRRVILPQAVKIMVPPTINQFVSILKYSGIVMLIGVGDLMFQVSQIYGQNFQQVPLLIVAVIWYGVMTGGLTILQYFLEQRFQNQSKKVRATKRVKGGEPA